MYTAIAYLSLIWACGITAVAIGDHAEAITARNLAAIRAEQTTEAYISSCGTGACDPAAFTPDANDAPGTRIHACATSDVLVVEVSVPAKPRLWIGWKTGTARTAETLQGRIGDTGLAPCGP